MSGPHDRVTIVLAIALVLASCCPFGFAQYCESEKLVAVDTATMHTFGAAVIVGDLAFIAGRNAGRRAGGVVYVFERGLDGLWVEVATLDPDLGPVSKFGEYFAVNADGTIIAVGAPQVDATFVEQGAVYVYEYDDVSLEWEQTAVLTADDGATDDFFGGAVVFTGSSVVVGAPNNVPGAIYIFDEPATGWDDMTETVMISGTGTSKFGNGLAADETTIFVAEYTGGPAGAGVVYAYELVAGTWTEVAELTPSDGVSGDRFGYQHCVALHEGTLVVGADLHDGTGQAYVFEKPATGWDDASEDAQLTASDNDAGDHFGFVAVRENLIVVGANFDDEVAANAGAAYVFIEPAGGWIDATEDQKLTASDGGADDRFGERIAIGEDVLLIAAENDDDQGDQAGACYAFWGCPRFLRGDCDGDGETFVLLDALYLLDYTFTGGPIPPCLDAADVDGNDEVFGLLDATYLLDYGFTGGMAPSDPGPETCGPDPAPDAVDCATPADCP